MSACENLGGDDIRNAFVLDLSEDVAGAYCSRLLASCGADVVQVEPSNGHALRRAAPFVQWGPEGSRAVSVAYEFLAAYKRGIVLESHTATGMAMLDALFARADIVISNGGTSAAGKLAQKRLAAASPRAVHVITTPFGLTGPYADRPSSALVDWAMSGYLYVTGDPDKTPVQGAGPWCEYAAGLTAAIGGIAAALYARKTGRGQVVDVGTMEAMANLHQWSFVLYTHQGVVKRRAGNRHAESHHPVGFFTCKDGSVCIGALGAPVWQAFCRAIGMPELLEDPRFATPADRFDNAEELDARLAPWLQARTRDEIVGYLQSHRVLAGKVLSPHEVLDDPQLEARDFWVNPTHLSDLARMPGLPFKLGERAIPYRRAPRLGEHTVSVLKEIGMDARTITSLCAAGIVQSGD